MAHNDPGMPFKPSNSTENLDFQECYCYRCAKNSEGDQCGDSKGDPCPILGRALAGTRVWQWVYDAEGRPSCSVFMPQRLAARNEPGECARRCSTTLDLFADVAQAR